MVWIVLVGLLFALPSVFVIASLASLILQFLDFSIRFALMAGYLVLILPIMLPVFIITHVSKLFKRNRK